MKDDSEFISWKMQLKRFLLRTYSSLGRNYLKSCSFRKVMTFTGIALLLWSALMVVSSSDLVKHMLLLLTSGGYTRTRHADVQQAFNMTAWTMNRHVFQYEHLIQENPLGTYFSDRLGGNAPIGTSHLHFYKKEQQKPLKMVLIFVRDIGSSSLVDLGTFFSQQRIEYRFRSVSTDLPSLVVEDIGLARYSLFVFDDYLTYLNMESRQKSTLDNYCRRNHVGILALVPSTKSSELEYFKDLKIRFQHRMKLEGFKLNPEADIWRVAKPEQVYREALPSSNWSVFIPDHETYKPLVYSTVSGEWRGSLDHVSRSQFACITAVHDLGLMDGIQKVMIGYELDFWLNSIVAMDAVSYLSNGRLALPLARLLQVDIDDMFVGTSGLRTLVKDAVAMAESQRRIRELVPGFTYLLGFSGSYYQKGNPGEQDGDKKIVDLAHQFLWFNHMYKHEQPHMITLEKIRASISKNAEFAREHKLPVVSEYMVTPHHSGVFPPHEDLYHVWNETGVICSSSAEYPRQSPLWSRRGFIYRGVMVLPRQVCNLYTSINRFQEYQGGTSSLNNSIYGGFLFRLFLSTPVLIFMTHMSNFANDQLAEYMFDNVVSFVVKWTNLQVLASPPLEIARLYFEMYPHDSTPIWTNPCEYDKHVDILPPSVNCHKFPRFIIVGPQKTGTTALQKFLEAHPNLVSTVENPVHFEEVQFFSGPNYLNGLEWYQNQFPEPESQNVLLFEKSANYFDSEITPKRIHALVPKVKIIIILAEPIRRAYSWFQNMRYHNDPVTRKYSFFEIVTAPDTAPKFLRDTRNRCLKSGAYAIHLARWLQVFPRNQIYLVDGDQLAKNPIVVLNQIQKFLNVQPYQDFSTKLRYDSGKGFYCRVDTGCLGPVKGRQYVDMDAESKRYLENYFTDHNTNLKIILNDIAQKYPTWLTESLTPS